MIRSNMLFQAANELRYLRQQNVLLAGQMRIVEIFATALGMKLQFGFAKIAEDLADTLEKAAQELRMNERSEGPPK